MPRRSKSTADSPTTSGRQYHLGIRPGDIAPRVLLVGDPARAEKVARRFQKRTGEWRNREFVTITGLYQGLDITVTGTGIGPDNMEIAVVELSQCRKNLTFIRVGSCGALQDDIELGDLVISTAAVRLENTSSFFVPDGFPAVANFDVTRALVEACAKRRHHVGITASAPGFYGAQSRKVPGFTPRFPDLPGDLGRLGVKNLEMEVSALFTLATISHQRAGAICAVYAQRRRNQFADAAQKVAGEARAIEAGLGALEILGSRESKP
jgi:uridine phosphorylase